MEQITYWTNYLSNTICLLKLPIWTNINKNLSTSIIENKLQTIFQKSPKAKVNILPALPENKFPSEQLNKGLKLQVLLGYQ